MPVTLQCQGLPLLDEEVQRLWKISCNLRRHPDDQVNIRCVSEEEIRTLNAQYRGKNVPTNVLTFSYSGEHDIALCLDVAEREAKERVEGLRDYVALLLSHAFLHVTGMDHERSTKEALRTAKAEQTILKAAGFTDISL